jgi:hypothetical protein
MTSKQALDSEAIHGLDAYEESVTVKPCNLGGSLKKLEIQKTMSRVIGLIVLLATIISLATMTAESGVSLQPNLEDPPERSGRSQFDDDPVRGENATEASDDLVDICLHSAHFSDSIPTPKTVYLAGRSGTMVPFPVYSTHEINDGTHPEIKKVLIVQHGYSRNAIDYFCAAYDTLAGTTLTNDEKENMMIIAPQILADGDTCWDVETGEQKFVKTDKPETWCGYPTFNIEGWLDGHLSHSSEYTESIYAYDIFNHLVELLGQTKQYPSLESVTLFGFSAGAQAIVRFALLPDFVIDNKHLKIRYIISNPSSFPYLDSMRPHHPVQKVVKHKILFDDKPSGT